MVNWGKGDARVTRIHRTDGIMVRGVVGGGIGADEGEIEGLEIGLVGIEGLGGGEAGPEEGTCYEDGRPHSFSFFVFFFCLFVCLISNVCIFVMQYVLWDRSGKDKIYHLSR